MWVIFEGDGIPGSFGPDEVPTAQWVDNVDENILKTCRWTGTSWVLRDPINIPEPTPEQLAVRLADAENERAKEETRLRKLIGFEFEGVMCSATSQDQSGLTAVLLSIQVQGAEFQPTRFEFENGSHLVITLTNYRAFANAWIPFRQSFFRP